VRPPKLGEKRGEKKKSKGTSAVKHKTDENYRSGWPNKLSKQ